MTVSTSEDKTEVSATDKSGGESINIISYSFRHLSINCFILSEANSVIGLGGIWPQGTKDNFSTSVSLTILSITSGASSGVAMR